MNIWRTLWHFILKDKIKNVGCKAPYEVLQGNFSVCSNSMEMKKSFNLWSDTGKEYPPPCQGISNIIYWSQVRPWYRQLEFHNLSLSISMAYPNEIKVITQSKKVDINSLIGYVGGYVGLLLGNRLFHYSLFSAIMILKWIFHCMLRIKLKYFSHFRMFNCTVAKVYLCNNLVWK